MMNHALSDTPSSPGRDKSLAPSLVIPAELVLVETGSGNPGVGWVERM